MKEEYEVFDNGIVRIVSGPAYNMLYHRWKNSGTEDYPNIIPSGELLRWGKNKEDDPDYCPIGPEIADIEISAGGCPGILNKSGKTVGCSFCYKGNTPGAEVKNMSLETYSKVLDKLTSGGTLTQVALGLTGVKDNPDLLDIMKYTISKNCFPNFTLTGADLDYEMAENLAELCGALAVSCSPTNPDLCFDTVKLFTDLGVEQTNIHVVVSQESMPFVYDLLEKRKTDPRLQNMGAIVGLMVKPKGRAKGIFHPPTQEQYEQLVHTALTSNIPIGFDSCSAHRFIKAVETMDIPDEYKKLYKMNSDPCESLCFSIYVNVEGKVYSCSFCEGEAGYEPIDLLSEKDFIKDVWHSSLARLFRAHLVATNRSCPAFPEIDECLIE